MQTSYCFLELASATLLEPKYDDTTEARVGQGLKSKLRATRISSRMP